MFPTGDNYFAPAIYIYGFGIVISVIMDSICFFYKILCRKLYSTANRTTSLIINMSKWRKIKFSMLGTYHANMCT